jgi:exonuclease SbcD
MKILHTADWHLGKKLDHFSRFKEQQEVLAEICEIADREAVDAVLIAGDLFDHANPSIEAIELFYKQLKRLSKNGHRPVIGIAGNHDAPDRIEAPDPLAKASGIFLLGYPHSHLKPIALDTGLQLVQSAPGFLELKWAEHPPLRLLLTPYANGFRMKRYLGNEQPHENLRQLLQAHWQELADTYCDEEGVNILMAHLFFMKKDGPKMEEEDDERPILTVGGAQEIFTENLPQNIRYVALGHLHRCHEVSAAPCPAVYSGSPLSYSFSEAEQQKYVILLDAEPGQPITYQKIPLTAGKALIRKKFDKIDEAIQWLEANPKTLIELSIRSDTYLTAQQRKQLYDAHDGIVALIPEVTLAEGETAEGPQVDLSESMQSLFQSYFKHKHGQEPQEELLDLFKEVLGEGDEERRDGETARGG